MDYFTADGSAIRGDDYTFTRGTLTFGPGESLKTVVVPIIDDEVEDSGETFTLHLRNPSGVSIVDGQATGTILNTEAENISATGLPTISGTPRVGETLFVVTSGIADADGLDHAIFSYQWFSDDGRMDTVIAGATGPSYTLSAADLGQSIKVRVNFTDDKGSQETLTSAATDSVAARPNNPATGLPTIGGTAQVGKTLTADVSAIADEDGLDNATFAYQWVSNEGTTDADIEDATASTYEVSATDVDRTLKVKVAFIDDAGFEEALTSGPAGPVAPRPDEPAADVEPLWSADMLVVEYTSVSIGAASADLFSNQGGGAGLQVQSLWYFTPGRELYLAFTDVVPGEDDLTLQVGGLALPLQPGDSNYTWKDVDVAWEGGQTVAARIVPAPALTGPAPNSPATGAPAITGTAQAGQTLTASTSGIADEDGLEDATFTYQWIRNDGGQDRGHTGRNVLDLHPGRCRRGEDPHGAGVLHR